MLSVCIPVFNVDVRQLALQLSEQASAEERPVELLFYDDGSQPEYRTLNRTITGLPHVSYVEMAQNLGRAAIRNRMGNDAAFSWLLFIDADSELVSGSFLKHYLNLAEPETVICGGTVYQPEQPGAEQRLRWVYGKAREELTASRRTRSGKFAITANNFMINRDRFLKIGFRETIRSYGHEDTVLGYDLTEAGIHILHTDNPVRHTGLEPSKLFLKKTETALQNLLLVAEEIVPTQPFRQEIKILRTYFRLKKIGLHKWTAWLFRLVRPALEQNLTGAAPRLQLFDLYRLGYLCGIETSQSPKTLHP